MSEKPKSTILEKYHRAISALPLDEQLERQQNIRSPKTLRRMLSADAPIQLVARFGNRLKEVAGLGLSAYEEGRVLHTQEKMEEAKRKFEDSVKSKDKRGHLGLAEVSLSAGTPGENAAAIKHLETAIKSGVAIGINHLQLGMLYFKNDQQPKAYEQFQIALEMSPESENIEKYLEGFAEVLDNNMGNAVRVLETAAQKGFAFASTILCVHFTVMKDYQKVKKYTEMSIKHGETRLYLKLGQLFEKTGDLNEAEKNYRKAIKAGHVEGCTLLASLIIAKNGPTSNQSMIEAKVLCDKAIAAGEPSAHLAITSIMALQGSKREAAMYLVQSAKAEPKLSTSGILSIICALDQFDIAIKFCQNRVAKEPVLHFILAMLYGATGNIAEASKQTRLAVFTNNLQEKVKEVDQLHMNGMHAAANARFREITQEAIEKLNLSPEFTSSITRRMNKSNRN